METVDTLQLSVASLALVVSVAAALYAAKVSRKVSSSDYASSERVKSETAKLLASLRSIVTKCIDALIHKEDVNLTWEQQSINEFVNSPTAFAYYAWAGLKSQRAGKGVSEKWRLLFTHVSKLSHSKDPRQCVQLAVELEAMFDSLGEGDLEIIVGFNSDLIHGIANAKEGRAGDPMLVGVHKILREDEDDEDDELVMQKLAFLKDLAVDDADVDLTLAVYRQDLDGVAAALDRGANVNVSIPGMLDRFEAQLAGFEEGQDED